MRLTAPLTPAAYSTATGTRPFVVRHMIHSGMLRSWRFRGRRFIVVNRGGSEMTATVINCPFEKRGAAGYHPDGPSYKRSRMLGAPERRFVVRADIANDLL